MAWTNLEYFQFALWSSLTLHFLIKLADILSGPLYIQQVRMKSYLPGRIVYLFQMTEKCFIEWYQVALKCMSPMRAVVTGKTSRQMYLCAPYDTMTVTCSASIVTWTVCSWSSLNRLNFHNSYFIIITFSLRRSSTCDFTAVSSWARAVCKQKHRTKITHRTVIKFWVTYGIDFYTRNKLVTYWVNCII